MKKSQFVLNLLAGLIVVFAFSATASAQATRTWVSGLGDDANPCSRTAPCKTFAGAISKTAAWGEIDCLDPGGFGALNITKAITIDCDSGTGGVLNSGTNGIVINAATTDVVTLRSLNIVGAGVGGPTGLNGIVINSAKAVHLYDMNIYEQTQAGVQVSNSALVFVTLSDVRIHDCANGVQANSTGTVNVIDLDRVAIWNTGNGISAQNGARFTVHQSTIYGSTNAINQNSLGGNGSQVAVSDSTISLNVTGILSIGGATMSTFNTLYSANTTAVNTNGGTICSGGNNSVFQNGSNGTFSGGCPASTI